MESLFLESVGKTLGGRRVLSGVSIEVRGGEVIALLGPNGAGKTTLLRVAAGFWPPTTGTVRIGPRSLASLSRREASRLLAALPAEEDAVFSFTVREAVSLGRHPWRGAMGRLSASEERTVDQALALVHLDHLAHRPLPSLSSGERQRAALARALVQEAGILLLDEPTAHQDFAQRLRLVALLRRLAREGRGVVVALHDLELAARLADRVALLSEGRLTAIGTPAEVLEAQRIEAVFGVSVRVLEAPGGSGPWIVPNPFPSPRP